MSRRTLVIGAAGYVGRCYSASAEAAGLEVLRAGRAPASGVDVVTGTGDQLDRTISEFRPDQVVTTVQLRDMASTWILERIDGPRWLVLSSAQLASATPAPNTREGLLNEELALIRGAVVLRPTMIFGRGGDLNISRIVRQLKKYGVSLQIGGDQLVQPLHVDDLCQLLVTHAGADGPVLPSPNQPFEVGGDAQLSVAELLDDLTQLTGARGPRIRVGDSALGRLGSVAGLAGVRPDQLVRITEDKVVDNADVMREFEWVPVSTPHRLEQAVEEVS